MTRQMRAIGLAVCMAISIAAATLGVMVVAEGLAQQDVPAMRNASAELDRGAGRIGEAATWTAPGHEITEETRAICTYIEALRFGLNPNGVVWTNCAEQHYWGEHQVVVRYWSTSTWDSYCVIYDRRGYDPNGWAISPPCLTGQYGLTGG